MIQSHLPVPLDKGLLATVHFFVVRMEESVRNREKGELFVIVIDETERKYIAERFPEVHIRRTVKQKSKRHRYYMEEARYAVQALDRMRGREEEKRGDRADGKRRKAPR